MENRRYAGSSRKVAATADIAGEEKHATAAAGQCEPAASIGLRGGGGVGGGDYAYFPFRTPSPVTMDTSNDVTGNTPHQSRPALTTTAIATVRPPPTPYRWPTGLGEPGWNRREPCGKTAHGIMFPKKKKKERKK